MTRDRRWHVINVAFLVLLTALACGPLGGGETPEPTQTPAPTETPAGPAPGQGRCGDGVCDEAEQANPSLCPQDCATREAASGGRCGNGICDEQEQQDPALCPQDCQVPSVETPIPPTLPPRGRARGTFEWDASYGPCQADHFYGEMEFTWSQTEDDGLTGSGEGTLYSEAVSRYPDTDYGGNRTVPYPVTVTGSVVDNGWVEFLPAPGCTSGRSVHL